MVLFPQISDIVLTHTKYQIWFSQISDFVFPDIRFCFPRYQILFFQILDLVFPDIRFGFSIYQIEKWLCATKQNCLEINM